MLTIAKRTFKSRLFLGTGKFSSANVMKESLQASGSEMVTVAVRRVDINNPQDDFLNAISPKDYLFLPNTSGARNAEEAIRIARLGRAFGVSDWVKLEVTPEPNYLLPDGTETLIAARQLVKEGFKVLPYINADPILAKHLEDAGCCTVMPLAAPIGTNKGLTTKDQIKIIIEQSTVPVVVDAGIGTPSHASEAMEMGADAVLVNTAIAVAQDPVKMALAFKQAVMAGRLAFESGIANTVDTAQASSPLTNFLRT
ncbi:thiazole synthase [Candidatus Marinamargulisbacteria bacterium SCGC AG-410-N11]|nr:thiazole synthase [Candidatus Marinamargulisbacteria bacterium SCGC AG-410-N11]